MLSRSPSVPGRWSPAWISSRAAKVDPPKTWDEFIEVCKKLQKPPKLTGYGMCLGLQSDTENNIMNMIWCYGGKLVEADNKTVALHSKGTIQAVQLIADMCHQAQDHPEGRGRLGQYRQQQSLSVTAGDFRLESHQHLCYPGESDKELYNVTGLLPIPAGPAGAIEELSANGMVSLQAQPLSRDG